MKFFYTIGIFLCGLWLVLNGMLFLMQVDFVVIDNCKYRDFNPIGFCDSYEQNTTMLMFSNYSFFAGIMCCIAYFLVEFFSSSYWHTEG